MKPIRPVILIVGLALLGGLSGATSSRANDWKCADLQGEPCLYPSLIFCFWRGEEVGACDCQEATQTYSCYHTAQTSQAASTRPTFFMESKPATGNLGPSSPQP